jgi:hypothetical protein
LSQETKQLLAYFADANEEMRRISEIEDSINSMAYISAMRYDGIGGTTGYCEVSKIERYVEKMIDLKEELERCKARLKLAERIRTANVLTKQEYELIEWLQLGGKLSKYAKSKGLYKSAVYKQRDKALRKIQRFINS